MRVLLSNWAWMQKADLTWTQLAKIRDALTVRPKKVGDYPGKDPDPIYLYVEETDRIGIAREFFLENRSASSEIELQVSEGVPDCAFDLEFAGDLREEQSVALYEVLTKLRNGSFGGILRASPGWGKSCKAGTLITSCITGKRTDVKDLVGEELVVPSLLPDGSIGSAVASKVWECGRKECYRLTLGSGQWLEASLDHPVLTQHGWKRLDELQPGREVLVAAARTALEPTVPIRMSDEGVIAAGLYIADGCNLHTGAAIYCKGSDDLVALFEDSIQHVPGFSKFGEKKFEHGAWYVRPHGVTPWIRKHGLDHRSSDKRIPGHLFGLSNRQLALLIRAIWTDGNLYSGCPRKLEIALGSEGLIDDLQEALRRFSIVARKSYAPKRPGKSKSYVPAWRLQIADKESLLLFAERVGAPFGMEEGFRQLLVGLQDAKTNTNWDVVPVGGAELREIRKECKHLTAVAWGKLSAGGGMRWMSRHRFQALVEATGYTGRYAKYASMDVVWEAVKSVEPIGMDAVYDLTVPGTENVIANGLVVHNTVWTCSLIAQMRVPTLIVVHKEFLADQWEQRIQTFLPNARVGRVQGDVMDITGKHIVVGMVHTLAAHELPDSFVRWPGLIVTDELHRIGAPTWSPVPAKFPARWRLGLTATPRRKDRAENVFWYQIGPILFDASEQRMKPKVRRVYTNFRVVKTSSFNPSLAPRALLVRFLVSSQPRNRAIAEQLVLAIKAGRKILVLSERLKHLDAIATATLQACEAEGLESPTFGKYVGGRTKAQLQESAHAQVVLATSQYAQEGLDIPPLDTLFLTTPLSDVEQAAGRILRPSIGKKDPIIVDFRDDHVPMFKKMSAYREATYTKLCR